MRRFLFLPLACLVILAGCLPAALRDATPDAAVIGVPADRLLPGAADALHEQLTQRTTGHDLVGRSGLRFREVRAGLTGSRAASGAARVARTAGAEVAVTIGAHELERERVGTGGRPVERVTLRLEVVLIDTEAGVQLTRLRGPRLVATRSLRSDELPVLQDDPLVRDLALRGVDALAPRVADALDSPSVSGSSGG